jgi:hypothetical protein
VQRDTGGGGERMFNQWGRENPEGTLCVYKINVCYLYLNRANMKNSTKYCFKREGGGKVVKGI